VRAKMDHVSLPCPLVTINVGAKFEAPTFTCNLLREHERQCQKA